MLVSWQFSGPYGVTKYCNGWRKDVVNQCLEFGIDVVIGDCSNQHMLCSCHDYLGKESGRRGRLMWGEGGRGECKMYKDRSGDREMFQPTPALLLSWLFGEGEWTEGETNLGREGGREGGERTSGNARCIRIEEVMGNCSKQLLHCFRREHCLESWIRGMTQSPSKNSQLFLLLYRFLAENWVSPAIIIQLYVDIYIP